MLNSLEKRILEISYKHKLSHIGSSLSCVNIIDKIYSLMISNDIFLLSCAHANLALQVVLEKYYQYNAEKLFLEQGTHSTINYYGVKCSGGSLGQVISCAIGFCLANKKRNVYCLISDGEWYEGVIFESLNFARENKLNNLKLYCNFNGYSAYNKIKIEEISDITLKLLPTANIISDKQIYYQIPFLEGQKAHYHIITDKDWQYLKDNYII